MSHLATVKTEIKDIEALKEAAALVGLTFNENKTSFKWYGRVGKCDHSLTVTGDQAAYEAGLTQNADGSFMLQYDFFGNEGRALQRCIGNDADRLRNEYGVAVATRLARSKGRLVSRTNLENGKIQLVVTQR